MDPTDLVPGTTLAVDPSSAWPVAGDTGAALGTGTSQHGVTPLLGTGGSVTDAINSVWSWLNAPFTTNMSAVNIALVVGIIICAIIMWNLILYHIRIAAETL